jgi:hypothetical protein
MTGSFRPPSLAARGVARESILKQQLIQIRSDSAATDIPK